MKILMNCYGRDDKLSITIRPMQTILYLWSACIA